MKWMDGHDPVDVVAALAPQLSPDRIGRIDAVLDARLGGLTVVLENLHDPHNGAAALRSVEGFGLAELHVVEQAEPFRFSDKVTQGCEKWVAIRRYPRFGDAAAALHGRGFRLHAAVPGAPVAVDDLDVGRPAALVFGNEHAGLTGAARAACDGTFAIPMTGFTQSFNLSVSVALSVHAAAARRRAALGAPGDLPAEERARLRARWYVLSVDPRAAQGIVERYVANRTR
ncbi:MAG TPA: RNA methyltransferase [Haliangiales bacterium]|nr:RNA methyltransferase [Haliangiales bacterium]